jgi:IS30 family transposase
VVAHMTLEQRQLAHPLRKELSLREIGRQVGCSHEIVRTIVRGASKRAARPDPWAPGSGRLTVADREEISLGLRGGESPTAIAARLGRATSTVS